MKDFAQLHPVLVRLPVKPGKEAAAKKWLSELKNRSEENRESMKIEGIEAEAVFSSTYEGTLYLSWFLLKKELDTKTISETHLDREHHQFLIECIDFDSVSEKETLEYSLTVDPEPVDPSS